MTKLTVKISELMTNAALKEEVIGRYKTELLQKDDTIATLTEENEALRRSVEQIGVTLKSLTVQNEKLMSANTALAASLEEENKRIIRLLGEKSEQTVEKLIAARKLDELNMKMSLMLTHPENPDDKPAEPIIVTDRTAS
jgi:cytochrome c-type biogenesis protein CcmH/NrfF